MNAHFNTLTAEILGERSGCNVPAEVVESCLVTAIRMCYYNKWAEENFVLADESVSLPDALLYSIMNHLLYVTEQT